VTPKAKLFWIVLLLAGLSAVVVLALAHR